MPLFLEGRTSSPNILFAVSTFYKEYSHDLMKNALEFFFEHSFNTFKSESFSVVFLKDENLVTVFLGDVSKIVKEGGAKYEIVKPENLADNLTKLALANQYLKFSFRNFVNTEIIKFSSLKILGSLELPQAISFALSKVKFDAVVAIGVIKKGQTSHDSVVTNECHRGLSEVAMKFHIPLTTAIINSENDEIIKERIDADGYNFGKQAVQTCLELTALKRKLDTQF